MPFSKVTVAGWGLLILIGKAPRKVPPDPNVQQKINEYRHLKARWRHAASSAPALTADNLIDAQGKTIQAPLYQRGALPVNCLLRRVRLGWLVNE
ncbi:MAG: hypothetical protein O2971_20250 [Proteobacteria bacterium]|nr:hypothetical protein [Pseudomonadota bacterium]